MHEMGLAIEMCGIIKKHAQGRPVHKAVVDIGRFSGVNRESFVFCAESIFQTEFGSNLDIEVREIPGQFLCSCGKEYESEELSSSCPACGGYDRTVTGGDDLLLSSIEVEE